jgi:hypothetical protein
MREMEKEQGSIRMSDGQRSGVSALQNDSR